MPRAAVLVVDDEEDIQELVRYNLAKEGYRVTTVGSGEAALESARTQPPDAVVLDLMLPGVDGLEVCRRLKADPRTRDIPVLMLTAKSEEIDVVTGLELGADDYLPKPFSARVLLARLRAVLRRAERQPDDDSAVLRRGLLLLDPGRHAVTCDGRALELTHTQFAILHLLARRPGWVFGRTQIVEAVRGDDYPVTDRSVDVHIVALRRELGAHGDLIETVRGVGYRFRE